MIPIKKSLTGIELWQKTYISGYNMYVLREKNTNTAINVSYSRDGLVWTTNQYGNYIYYKNPRIFSWVEGTDKPQQFVKLIGDSVNPNYYIEKFVPRDHIENGRFNLKKQLAEYFVTAKALRALTPMNVEDNSLNEIRSLSYN